MHPPWRRQRPLPEAAASTQSPRAWHGALRPPPQDGHSRVGTGRVSPAQGLRMPKACSWARHTRLSQRARPQLARTRGGDGGRPHGGQRGTEGRGAGWLGHKGWEFGQEGNGWQGGRQVAGALPCHTCTPTFYPSLSSGHDDSPGKARPNWVATEHLAPSRQSELLTWRRAPHTPAHLSPRPPSRTPPWSGASAGMR